MDFDIAFHPSWAVTAAALIAETDGLYYYFASECIVQSSQDIVEHFRSANSFIKLLGYDGRSSSNGFFPLMRFIFLLLVTHKRSIQC